MTIAGTRARVPALFLYLYFHSNIFIYGFRFRVGSSAEIYLWNSSRQEATGIISEDKQACRR